MTKNQYLIIGGVAIVLLVSGFIWVNSKKNKPTVIEPSKAEQAKTLIDKLYLLDHNGGILMSDDARRIFSANVDLLKTLSIQELDSLLSVLNKMNNNTATDSEKDYLNTLSDNLSL